ncbi:hypothetical protein AB0L40_11870 [Patulibacter sp. NPDC049589]|uniref:hypothetical protein n=1 Tax=Patulibacter sp. NPDC049589 TaxID=3154731 RepID=UPI00343B0CDD
MATVINMHVAEYPRTRRNLNIVAEHREAARATAQSRLMESTVPSDLAAAGHDNSDRVEEAKPRPNFRLDGDIASRQNLCRLLRDRCEVTMPARTERMRNSKAKYRDGLHGERCRSDHSGLSKPRGRNCSVMRPREVDDSEARAGLKLTQ